MNWTEAVEAMKRGATVQRKSQQYSVLVDSGEDDESGGLFAGIPLYECGEEGIRLAMAYTEDGRFVRVFQGESSKVLFEPEDRHTDATDWVEVKEEAAL
jgi:hypothetical protein